MGIVFLYFVATLWVTDTNYFNEDNVIVPEHIKEDAHLDGRVTEEDIRQKYERETEAADKGGSASIAAMEEGSSKDGHSR